MVSLNLRYVYRELVVWCHLIYSVQSTFDVLLSVLRCVHHKHFLHALNNSLIDQSAIFIYLFLLMVDQFTSVCRTGI